MDEKYYKVIGADGKSPTTRFDYSDYLPESDGTPGKWLPEIPDSRLLSDGYYASKYWNMWYVEGARIYEVEMRGVCRGTGAGVETQVCCAQIRLIRDATDALLSTLPACEFPQPKVSANTGVLNTGSRNTGNCNVGDFNTGNRNTGSLNSGDFNTGDRNSGMDNVGDGNFGTGNVGCENVGHSNTGSRNKGSYNSGSCNVGFANSGSFNIGNRNSGNWNIGSRHCGYFNTREPCAFMFDKPTNLKFSEIRLPKWLNFPNPREAFETATSKEVEQTLALPNFDFQIFEKITGISKSDFTRKLGRLPESAKQE